jgi:hypothetical protein
METIVKSVKAIKIGLQQWGALSPLPFNFALEYAITKPGKMK